MKQEFHEHLQKSIEESEGRMTVAINQHIGELMRKSEDVIARIESKASDVADKILLIVQDNNQPNKNQNENRSPARKLPCSLTADVEMTSDADATMYIPITPANHLSLSQHGQDTVSSERK